MERLLTTRIQVSAPNTAPLLENGGQLGLLAAVTVAMAR
jgi:hypothetical protein